MCISRFLRCHLKKMLNFAARNHCAMIKLLFLTIFMAVAAVSSFAQSMQTARTAHSLFWRTDSLQVDEIVTGTENQYRKIGHHGPAVENSHMALRIYFNDSGAIDVYSKSGRGMELLQYLWYPTAQEQAELGVGCDEYRVGKTVGFGGIALWDGEKEVKLVATKGRTARVGDSKKGSYAEVIAYGVAYMGDMVDISIRIDVTSKSRIAVITASELSGKKVQFLTGVNYHEGQQVSYGDDYISIWGIHPADVSTAPIPLGSGMFYSSKTFPTIEKTADMVRIISKPASKVQTKVIAASTKEAELNTAKRFEAYMTK